MPPTKKRELAELLLQRQAKRKSALWNADKTARDVLVDVKPFCQFDRNGIDVEISFTAPGQANWSADLAKWLLDLTRRNMKHVYDAAEGWRWKDASKKDELYDTVSRFIIARQRS